MGNQWLDDEVIDCYFNHILQKKASDSESFFCFRTHFFSNLESEGYEKVKRWTKNIDLFNQFRKVFVPIHQHGNT